jgi:hypothetical protein
MAASVALVALAGCGGAHRRPSKASAGAPWHEACGDFAQHDPELRSLAWTFRLDPYLPTQSAAVVRRVRTDLAMLKPYLTHGERIGLGRYLTGVDSVELGIDAYLSGDVHGARQNFSDGLADLHASGLTGLCARG